MFIPERISIPIENLNPEFLCSKCESDGKCVHYYTERKTFIRNSHIKITNERRYRYFYLGLLNTELIKDYFNFGVSGGPQKRFQPWDLQEGFRELKCLRDQRKMRAFLSGRLGCISETQIFSNFFACSLMNNFVFMRLVRESAQVNSKGHEFGFDGQQKGNC